MRKYFWEDAAPDSPSRTDRAVQRANVSAELVEVRERMYRQQFALLAPYVNAFERRFGLKKDKI